MATPQLSELALDPTADFSPDPDLKSLDTVVRDSALSAALRDPEVRALLDRRPQPGLLDPVWLPLFN